MANFNDDGLVNEIKRRLSIIDLIESYTSVKKTGRGYVGLCPFHDDRNPSMHIDEEKGLFHCFSCGAGGDILGFYMRYNNTTFPEALQELAKRANIPIEKTAPRAKGSSAAGALFKINSIVSKYYQKTLEESARGKPALEYIAKRGIPRDVATEFGLGYAPDALYDRIALGNRLIKVENFAAFGALKLGWTGSLRSTFAVGYSHADYPGGVVVPGLANVAAYSAAANLFWSPVKNLDIGIEVRHAEREVANGLKGQMDRLEMAAKYTF